MSEKGIAETGGWTSTSDHDHIYDKHIDTIIKQLVKTSKAKKVYDFGCGHGVYLKNIHETFGIDAIGFEYDPQNKIYDNIQQRDLSTVVEVEPAEMTISLEVGEHISPESEQIFLDNICNSTNNVLLLSWGIEGQPGVGHINCRNNDYIIDQVEARGFRFVPSILNIRKHAEQWWFRESLMLFYKLK
jgi:tryptophanyl-tRNA synthetase